MNKKNNQELVVVKSNKIIEARYKLNIREQKFILYVASLIKPDDKIFRYQKVKVKEIEKVLNTGNSKWGSIYKDVEDIIYSLNTKPLRIIKDNGEKLIINWIASANIKPNSGYVTFEFSDELRPYLLQLKSHFTKYQFKNILHLKSGYSIRLYEILKSHEFKSEVTYEVDNLKYILGLENKYAEYKAFKRSVLKKAQKELKERSDIYFELEEEREQRKVKYLKFYIYKNKNVKSERIAGLEVATEVVNEGIISRIKNIGYSSKKAIEIYKKGFDWLKDTNKRRKAIEFYEDIDAYFDYKLKMLHDIILEGKVKNPKGYFIKSLEEDYHNKKMDVVWNEQNIDKKIKSEREKRKAKKTEIEKLSKSISEQRQELVKQLVELDLDILMEAIVQGKKSHVFQKSYDDSKTALENYHTGNPIVKSQIHLLITKAYPDQFKLIRQQELELEKLKEALNKS